jgi:hypothetical protein
MLRKIMRAICEACGHVQPPDWKPGDLCTTCGTVVRREKRCHWCVQLTPAGKYCRHCGAGQVPDEQYGAARWLKHLGSDQFLIPDRLAAMDSEQVTHFERLYQRHAIVAERHLDDVALAESLLRQRGWARSLEEELLPLLPLPDDQLKALMLPPRRGTTEGEKLLEIRETSPFSRTQALAALARLRIWQASADELHPTYAADRKLALSVLQSPDLSLRQEAALTLSHWRLVTSGIGLFGEREIVDTLRQGQAAPLEAAVNLALIQASHTGAAQSVPLAALASEDADLAFAAALAAHHPEPLLASLRQPVRCFAAAVTLTRMGADFVLAPLLPAFSFDQLNDLLYLIAGQRRPRPDLRAFLRAAATGQYGHPPRGLDTIRQIQLLDLQPGDAVQLLLEMPAKPFSNHDGPDWGFIKKVLEAPSLPPGEELLVCYELVRQDLFQPQQLSTLRTITESNRLPLEFVTDNFRTAPPKSLSGLRDVIEFQLGARGVTGPYGSHGAPVLHPFLRGIMWDRAAPLTLRNTAGWALKTWYSGGYAADERPELQLTEVAAVVYFGSFESCIEQFTYCLEHTSWLDELDMGPDFLRPLQKAAELTDDNAQALLRSLAGLPSLLVERLRAALVALARDYEGWSMPKQWAIRLLGLQLHHPAWSQDVRAGLQSLRGGDYDYLIDQQLAT